MKYECYPYHRLIRNDTCRYRKSDRKEGLTFCKSLSKVTGFFLTQRRTVSFHMLLNNYCFIDR